MIMILINKKLCNYKNKMKVYLSKQMNVIFNQKKLNKKIISYQMKSKIIKKTI